MSRLYRDALAYARARRVLLPDAFYSLPIEARQWAFAVTGLASLDQAQGVLDGLNQAVESGQTFADWQKAALADPALGRLPRGHLDNVFRTNLQSAYNQGRDAQFDRNRKARPYLMWDAINDGRTRPEHARWDGFIARVDDPVWQAWHGRNPFRCRCKRIALTEAQAIARGLNTQGAPPNAGAETGVASSDWRGGVGRAINNRLAQCVARTAAKNLLPPAWCLPGPIRDALEAVQARILEHPEAALERELRAGLRGERYDLALDRLRARGVLGGPLPDAEAAALYLWSGDNAAKKEPDGTFPYQVIGRALREMGQGRSSPEWEKVAAIMAGTMRALSTLPEPDVPELFRGFGMVKGDFQRAHLTEGAVFQYNSLTSFSSRIAVAQDFASRVEDGWVMVLYDSRQARDIGVYSALPSGAEFLAPLQRQYRVIKVDAPRKLIEVEEVAADQRRSLPRPMNLSEAQKDARFEETARRLDEARRNPRPLTEAEELVGWHMLYG